MAVSAFPWDSLPVVSRDERIAAAWVGAIGDGMIGGFTWRGGGGALRGDEVIVAVRRGAGQGWIAVPAVEARAIADVVLGRPAELAAPRPVTPIERALAGLAVGQLVAPIVPDAIVEGAEAVVRDRACLVATVAITTPIASELIAIVPRTALRAAPASSPRVPIELPDVRVAIEVARASIAPSRLAGIAKGDVIVLGPRAVQLAIARGSIAAALDPQTGAITVAGPYVRDPDEPHALADDLAVPLTIVIGELTLPAREVLALAPGQVLSLGAPVGGAVEVRAGGRTVGRGELVVVDGDLGVRLLDVLSPPPPAC